MSDNSLIHYSTYTNQGPKEQRVMAVNAALELIAARVTTASVNGTHLSEELKNLSTYADQIQAAISKQ